MFQPVSSRVNLPQLEEEILDFWRKADVFRKTEAREGAPLFVLYEGPPTANGLPGIHHVLSRVYKDVIPRYKTMRGYRPFRKGGWDTHGLPVELEVEKELGISTKREIENIVPGDPEASIAEFNRRCRDSVFRYVKEWERLTERVGFWVDMEDAYITYDNNYIETGWWILKQLWDKGLLYEGHKVTPHCPRCVTTLSSHEVSLGYKDDTVDPSIHVLFRVMDTREAQGQVVRDVVPTNGETYLMAWTTTPWTLPGNTALAVAPDAEYVMALMPDGRRIILAAALAGALLDEGGEVVATFPGSALAGVRYEPLFNPFTYGARVQQFQSADQEGGAVEQLQDAPLPPSKPFTYAVVAAGFVTLEDGSGIVHSAPAFGEDDYSMGKATGAHFIQHVDQMGIIQGRYPFAGKFVKDADPLIIRDLEKRGLLYKQGVYTHTYPFCWRCDAPLLYYAKPSWYIRTTAVKDRLLSGNEEVNWFPEHIKTGRFGDWLRNNVDWAVSRERYWGTPLPIWRCDQCGKLECMGSAAEMKDRMTPDSYTQYQIRALGQPEDLHRPYVDEVVLRCADCRGEMRRAPDVLDCWFDSGAMPFAQWHYPYEHQDEVDSRLYFPADYICEAVDQTRGWFYSLHALSTLLKDGPAYRNVICLGLILDQYGDKMSKSKGNVVEPWEVIDAQGADALRWYLFASAPPGNSRRFSKDLVEEAVRRFFLPLWNVYSFFVTYANLDGFNPTAAGGVNPKAELDRWLLSEINLLVRDTTEAMDVYNPTDAARRLEEFVELLSNWYVRRSRRRFWKSENDEDKQSAYVTLYTCLVTVSTLLAPLTPFLAESLYQNLVKASNSAAPESVHLAAWPQVENSLVDEDLSRDVALVRRVTSLGHAARSRAGIKVRQPLQRVLVKPRRPEEAQALGRFAPQLLEELNVKELQVVDEREAIRFVTLRPEHAKLGPRLGADMPGAIQALAAMDPAQLYAKLSAGEVVEIDGMTIQPDEIRIEATKDGAHAATAEAGYVVAVDTNISQELAEEGLVRELVHRIQNMRRAAGFAIADRIVTTYTAGEAVRRAVSRFRDYIRQETLSVELAERDPQEGAFIEEHQLEGEQVVLAVKQVE